MANQKFIIQKNTVEIGTHSRENVHELQNRISQLFNYRLMGEMENYFEKVIPENLLLRLDKLELNLGSVNLQSLEDELTERFMDALQNEFSQRLQFLQETGNSSLSGFSVETVGEGKLQLLEYFLINGALPWFADTATDFNITGLLDYLYQNESSALQNLIRAAGRNENVRKRLSYHFSDKSLHQLISILEPAESGYIIQSHTEIISLQKKQQIVQSESSEFSKAVWLFILDYLLVEKSSEFNRKMFLKSNLSQIAARFNISYQQLLKLFYQSLEQERPLSNFRPLKSVIYDLYTDETIISEKPKPLRPPGRIPTGKIIYTTLKTDIVEYYLQFGSLPWGYQQSNPSEIAAILLQSAEMAPRLVRNILYAAYKSATQIERLHNILGKQDIKNLVHLLFTGRESKLNEIALAFQALQESFSFVKLYVADLQKELWKYLFDSILVSGDPGLSENSMVRAVLFNFEWQYGKGRGTILLAVEESLQKAQVLSVLKTPMVAVFNDALTDLKKVIFLNEAHSGAPFREKGDTSENEKPDSYSGQARLGDTLRYVLKYGTIPWWGQMYYHVSLTDMITELNQIDPNALILIFREASSFPQMKEKLSSHIPFPLALQMLQELPNGKDAVDEINGVLGLLKATDLLKYQSETFIQKTVFTFAWDQLSSTGYKLFSPVIFYLQSVLRFSALLEMHPGTMTAAILEVSKTINNKGVSSRQSFFLSAILDHLQEYKKTADNILSKLLKTVAEPPEETINPLLLQYLPRSSSAGNLLQNTAEILRYFLQWNCMPDSMGSMSGQEYRKVLRVILLYIFKHDQAQLKTILSNPSYSVVAKVFLNELFIEDEGGVEKQLSDYLFDNSMPGPEENWDERIKRSPELLFGKDRQVLNLNEIFHQGTGLTEIKSPEFILQRSVETLTWFLKHGHLPSNLDLTDPLMTDLLLTTIMSTIFQSDRQIIRELFDKPGDSVKARLQLYDLLAAANDKDLDELAEYLGTSTENDLKDSLVVLDSEIAGKEAFVTVINRSLQREFQGEKVKEINELLSRASFARLVHDKYGKKNFLNLVSNKITWPTKITPIVQKWDSFISKAIPGGLDNEKITDLFTRFNINFVSGRLQVNSDESYTRAFFHYLSIHIGTRDIGILNKLFKHTTQPTGKLSTGETTQLNLLKHLIPAQIIKLEELKTLEKSITAFEEKKLSVAVKEEILTYRKRQLEELKNETREQDTSTKKDAGNDYLVLQEDQGESIYIFNAGLVLFHPFLETYFGRTGLMNDNHFTGIDSRNRAVLLLQYLANGKTEFAEHELVLNKILCNVPIEEAIPVFFEINETERAVTDELFSVFIERWPKVKNSTPDGLRNSFILREGRLMTDEGNWLLKVEQKGFDILLQSYPWSFSSIKNRWMDQKLIVEWI